MVNKVIAATKLFRPPLSHRVGIRLPPLFSVTSLSCIRPCCVLVMILVREPTRVAVVSRFYPIPVCAVIPR
jgi:hypothetical protein